ncbi:hypothetical protein IE077_000480 [Cardiosporidium cionae]|uniref:Mediator of RNA polymerase II transcription subunit 21 n=1 Tax=Cardiosporidium cionae TaxID=476202 RepID=A0ABQ7JF73_9APIC|nr:hypothetical protein IE077_000480 [Cardiosporidium cionae]|eukprot:KAF8822666.1 hypothetical protein IE077_000480 [Cardiosporidium cionae]
MNSSSGIAPPFPSPPAEDCITRLQFLLSNSLTVFVDSIHSLSVNSQSLEAKDSLHDGKFLGLSETANDSILSHAQRLGLMLQLIDSEIVRLPNAPKADVELAEEIFKLHEENDEVANQLQELADTALPLYEAIRIKLRSHVNYAASQLDEAVTNRFLN